MTLATSPAIINRRKNSIRVVILSSTLFSILDPFFIAHYAPTPAMCRTFYAATGSNQVLSRPRVKGQAPWHCWVQFLIQVHSFKNGPSFCFLSFRLHRNGCPSLNSEISSFIVSIATIFFRARPWRDWFRIRLNLNPPSCAPFLLRSITHPTSRM